MTPPPVSGPTDEALALAAGAGDRGALEILLGRHFDRIHAICWRITNHREDALDATQEALIAVTRGIHRYDGRSAFTTWLYRVATNAALDELRRRGRRPIPVEAVAESMPDGGGSVESMVGARIDVDAALATLVPEFRVAVVLRDLCDLDYAEIADTLGVPLGTVRSRIARGRAAIAAHLGADSAGKPSNPGSGEPDARPERQTT